jgi:dihydroorotase (multifunctional complex type)
MAEADIVVTDGNVWTPGGFVPGAQIVIAGEKITEVRSAGDPIATARERIDASGKVVIPGLIDTHSHHRDPGFTHKEDITTASRAAAAGGVTLTIGMPNVDPPTTTVERFSKLIDDYSARSVVDFNHNPSPTDVTQVPGLADLGCLGFKIFMVVDAQRTYPHMPGLGVHDHGQLIKILAAVKDTGRPLMVHPNDQEILGLLEEAQVGTGDLAPEGYAKAEWKYDGIVWSSAVAFLIELQRSVGGHVHVLHMMSDRSVDLIRKAKADGLGVTAEVNAFALFLSDWDEVAHLGPYALGRCLKPEWRAALWDGIADGTIDVLGTDHAPHTSPEKERGWENMWAAPTGTPQLQHYLLKLLDAASKGRITLEDVVRITSERPAKLFGIFPRKGAIQPGSDADFVVVNLDREFTIRREDVYSKCGWTPYDGVTVQGHIDLTMCRGRVVSRDGKVVSDPGWGELIPPTA